MKTIRVFGAGIGLGYLLGSGKARQILDALQSSGGASAARSVQLAPGHRTDRRTFRCTDS